MVRGQQDKITSRRLVVFGWAILVIGGLLASDLFTKSVINHRQALAQAKKQHLTELELLPKRGTIYAQSKDGLFPLATVNETFQVLVVPRNVQDHHQVANVLADKLGFSSAEIFAQINNRKLYVPPIKKRVDVAVAQSINDLHLAGVIVVPEWVRYYPEGELAAQLLGFVDFGGDGRYGVEGAYNEETKGYRGRVVGEKDNKGRLITPVDVEQRAQNGSDLVLTIDHNIQFKVQELLQKKREAAGAESAQAIVADPKTGKILALAVVPSFDPNKFNEVKTEDQQIFLNPTISLAYEPGSIMKPFTVSAGLDTGKFEPDTIMGNFGQSVVVQGYEINTALDRGYGEENPTQILMNSDNVGMVTVAERVGNETIHAYLESFGFGRKTGVDLEGEITTSLLPLKQWRDIHRATMSFGQGIAATPMQVITAYMALINGGELLRPQVVEKILKTDGSERVLEPQAVGHPIKSETAEKIRRMLERVVAEGQAKRAGVKGYRIGGKTGTAQVAKPEGGYFEDKTIHSFVGFGPVNDPKFIALIKFDYPTNVRFAEGSAGVTFSELAKFLFNYYQIAPTEPVD